VRAHASHIIGILAVQANQIFSRGIGQRRLGEELRQARVPLHQPILAEVLLVEKGASSQPVLLLQIMVQEFRVALDLDAQLPDQRLRAIAVRIRSLDSHGPAEADERFALIVKLVSLGVPAEVIVIVEDQDLRAGLERCSVEVGRRKTRDARSHDDEFVFFADIDSGNRRPGVLALADRIKLVHRRWIVTSKPCAQRRIVFSRRPLGLCPREGRNSRRYSNGDAVQKIPPRYRPVHP